MPAGFGRLRQFVCFGRTCFSLSRRAELAPGFWPLAPTSRSWHAGGRIVWQAIVPAGGLSGRRRTDHSRSSQLFLRLRVSQASHCEAREIRRVSRRRRPERPPARSIALPVQPVRDAADSRRIKGSAGEVHLGEAFIPLHGPKARADRQDCLPHERPKSRASRAHPRLSPASCPPALKTAKAEKYPAASRAALDWTS